MKRVLLVPDLAIERWHSMDRYASRLIQHLGSHPDLHFSMATRIGSTTLQPDDERTARRSGARFTTPVILRGFPGELIRYALRYFMYPSRVARMESDIVHVLDHSYAHILDRTGSRPTLVTVHDLQPLRTVKQQGRIRDRIRNRFLRRVLNSLRTADAWLVGTEWMRGELAEWLGGCADRIFVAPLGVDDEYFADEDEAAGTRFREQRGIPADAFVVLHVGAVTGRKNFPVVVEAVSQLRARGIDAWMLQVGGTLYSEQRRRIAEADMLEHTVLTGVIPERDLRATYKASDVLLFPSHYEGFGLPVLEAMASDVPVVSSGAGGMGELVRDAAAVVQGRELGPYVEQLMRIATDPGWRDALIARGRKRAREYTWQRCAEATLEVYNTVG